MSLWRLNKYILSHEKEEPVKGSSFLIRWETIWICVQVLISKNSAGSAITFCRMKSFLQQIFLFGYEDWNYFYFILSFEIIR